jgi:hypothetical protein
MSVWKSGADRDMSRHMAERTTVRLPEELIRRAKRKAAAQGRTLTALIEDGVRRVLKDSAPSQKKQRILPPVDTAAGGLLPEIGPNIAAAVQELEDLEYAKRLRDGFA